MHVSTDKKINFAIIGSKGMLGSDLCLYLKTANLTFEAFDHTRIDIRNKADIESNLAAANPDIIINCAAYTNVDKAEMEADLAYEVNCIGPKNLAEFAADRNAIFCHVSTDYVFDGEKNEPYIEKDKASPLNVYGASKLAGEKEVKKIAKHYIIRTSWLFGRNGKDFIKKIIKASEEKKNLRIVNDQFGSPTYTADLAKQIVEIIKHEIPFGLYHVTNDGITTWYKLAKEALKTLSIDTKITPILSSEYQTKAPRPKYSALNNYKLYQHGLNNMPSWQNALKRYIHQLHQTSTA